MGLLRWFTRGGAAADDARQRKWRTAWAAAVDSENVSAVTRLRTELDALGCAEEDIEIEREMLDALAGLEELVTSVRAAGLPAVATGHRIVALERCHFSAPASMPDEPSQPSGRLLLTHRRAVFVGGPVGRTIAWHGVGEIAQVERDLVLLGAHRQPLFRFRCNGFDDVLRGAFIARELKHAARLPPQDL
jgi:hypothetical protein